MSPLRGRRVLVTRPRHQSAGLVALLQQRGAHVLELPLFDIEPLPDPDAQRIAMAAARGHDGWVFTSTNAVAAAAALDAGPWPALYAVGAATARALSGRGRVLTAEDGSTSEALLARPELQSVRGQHYLLLTGAGGRDALEATLRQRGATVTRLELYRRVAVEHPHEALAQALQQAEAAVLTSAEGLLRLHQLTPAALLPRLLGRVLVVPSARVVEVARRLGFAAPHAPPAMSDDALVACLERAFGSA